MSCHDNILENLMISALCMLSRHVHVDMFFLSLIYKATEVERNEIYGGNLIMMHRNIHTK